MVVGQGEANLPECDHDELCHPAPHSAEGCYLLGVERVKILVDLVEVVEWAWLVVLDGENQCQRRHRLLPSGKSGPPGVLALARGHASHFQPPFEWVVHILQFQFSLSCWLEYLVHAAEVVVDVGEYIQEACPSLVF